MTTTTRTAKQGRRAPFTQPLITLLRRSQRTPITARIDDEKPLTVRPRETVLSAALREGVDLPSSCRVGGCGTCKCRLVEGEVKELTETGYLLTEDEIARGVILACQSVPQTDVRIERIASSAPLERRGRVVRQTKLTHDITRLEVQLDEPLAYKSGQLANVTLPTRLPGVRRSYSFATPPREDGVVTFFVRKVPGGRLSTVIHDEDLVGQAVHLEGPLGDFWLRPAEDATPLVLVAGGSGLAPILALLREAATSPETSRRPVTLLFGAREERDLYAQGEIEEIARAWRGPFELVPVLSAAPPESRWEGERGLVTDVLAKRLALFETTPTAYLCGSPAMVDRACDVLREHGVAREHVHFDRFVTALPEATLPARSDRGFTPKPRSAVTSEANESNHASTERWAGPLHYLKFFSFHAIGLFAVATLLAGGPFITAGLLAVLALYIVGDAISGDDTATPKFKYPIILTAQLWLGLPLLSLIVFCAVWSFSTAGDPLGFGAWATHLSGYDLLAARDATSFGHHVSAVILTGLMIGMVGTITAHELTHRTWEPVSLAIGRWLLAFSFDTAFAIEHVYGHHRYVATLEDPATAPRGRNVYVHVIASTIKGNISAWKIEASRLRRRHRNVLSLRNAVIRGHLMSVALVVAAWAIGGLHAALYFTLCALWGKALLEIVNYMEHYGIVRNPKTPVQPRHSWNTNRRLSSWTMFNLTRHSHHHAQGEVPYHDLEPYPEAPMMISGYLTTIVIAMIPPLWHWLMKPKVLAWDRDFATEEERQLAAQANTRAPKFRDATYARAS